jgi:hypothetical protein
LWISSPSLPSVEQVQVSEVWSSKCIFSKKLQTTTKIQTHHNATTTQTQQYQHQNKTQQHKDQHPHKQHSKHNTATDSTKKHNTATNIKIKT